MNWEDTSHPRIKRYEDARTGKPRYLVRYRKPDGKQTKKRGFTTMRDAQRWLTDIENAKNTSQFVEVSAGRTKVQDLSERWLTIKKSQVKESTYRDAEGAWRKHVKPTFGNTAVAAIRASDVEVWAASIDRSPTVVRRAYGVLCGLLDLAVKDRLIVVNPAQGVRMPRPNKHRNRYLSHVEVAQVVQHTPEHFQLLVEFLAYTGLRWGEATALTPADIDGVKVHVTKSISFKSSQRVGSTKTHENRVVVMPAFLAKKVGERTKGLKSDALIFPSPKGEYLRSPSRTGGSVQNRWWANALEEASIEYLRPHDLRHTAASLAVQSGANVKVVQRMLGHASATLTLDVYSDLFDGDLGSVAEALDRARAEALAA